MVPPGGVAEHECVEAAWDAQAEIEEALLESQRLVFASYDQYKYFESFDHTFIRSLLIAHGVPGRHVVQA